MSDIKWIKLATSMPDDEKMKLIDAMPERDTVHYLWIRLLIQAGKTNADGEIFLSDGIPYTDKMLSIIFSRSLVSIKLALKTFRHLGMIEISSDHIIRIVNWHKYQSVEGMDRVRDLNRKRAENHRRKKKLENALKDNKEDEENIEEQEENQTSDNLEEKLNTNYEENENSRNEDYTSKNSAESDEDDVMKRTCFENNNSENNIQNEEVNITTQMKNNDDNIVKINGDNKESKCNVIKKSCDVTQNESNVTIISQNKKQMEKKKKIKKEIDNKNINLICQVKNKNSVSHKINHAGISIVPDAVINPIIITEEDDDINASSMRIMFYYEKITGMPGGGNSFAIRKAIDNYGEQVVKMAIDAAFEQNHTEIKYINGILKNWEKDGYPKDDMEMKKDGVRSNGKINSADKNEFAGFKPKTPRKLTEEQRKDAEANLI